MNQQISIHPEFLKWIADIIGDKDYFGCIYWSYASNTHTKDSDIDLYCAMDVYSEVEMNELIWYVKDYYSRNNLSLDEEVPFENKLLARYSEISSAIHMGWFEMQNNQFKIPRIQKNTEFLSSSEIKKRLLLNTLTTPHIVFGNNTDRFTSFTNDAEKNMLLLSIDLVNKTKFKVNELIDVLTISNEWETWEMYLWYKTNKDPISRHLGKFIKKQINFLVQDGIIEIDANETISLIKLGYLDDFKRKCALMKIHASSTYSGISKQLPHDIKNKMRNDYSKNNIYSLIIPEYKYSI